MDTLFINQHESLERDHWWWQTLRQIVIHQLNLLTPPSSHRSLLDVGCGAGINLGFLESTYSCTGMEPDPYLRRISQKNTHCRIYSDLLPLLPKTTQKYDFILLLDVLEHIQDDLTSLKSLSRHLKPGGSLLINVPANPSLWSVQDEIAHHYRRYTWKSFHHLISQTDLRPTYVRFWGHTLAPLVIFRKLLSFIPSSANFVNLIPPRPVNKFLKKLIYSEYLLTRSHPLPWGLSIFATLTK